MNLFIEIITIATFGHDRPVLHLMNGGRVGLKGTLILSLSNILRLSALLSHYVTVVLSILLATLHFAHSFRLYHLLPC